MNKRTGDCYRRAYHHLNNLHYGMGSDWVLCHGVVIGTGPRNFGRPCGHAWLESASHPTVVLDATGRMVLKAVYYHVGRINRGTVRRYTYNRAQSFAARTGHYGPWNSAIIRAERWLREGE